jgi:RecA-family ATPase
MDAKPFQVEPLRLSTEPVELRPPVVDGLFRRGECCNWIAAPKTGKTWLVYTLVSAILRGKPWCGFPTRTGRVLLVDNELHRETGLQRLQRVFHQSGMDWEEVESMMDVAWLRGRRAGLEELETTVRQYPRGTWSLIVLDAFYRFLPRGCDENSNSDMAQVMNHIDAIAGYADAAIVNVHHATKGGQAGKDVMDIGAGAGAIGRATDSHIVFLRHAEDDCITMRARCRSFRPPTPCVVQLDFQFPRAWVRDDLNPDQLYTPEPTRKGKGA